MRSSRFAMIAIASVLAISGANATEPLAPTSLLAEQLTKIATQAGGVTITVQLRLEGEATGSARSRQIALTQARFMRRLGLQRQLVRTYRQIPSVVLRIDTSQVASILADAEVLSVEIDSYHQPQLDQSIPIIRADQVTDATGNAAGGHGQTVVVVDSGIDNSHRFIAGRSISGACFSSGGMPVGQRGVTPLCSNGTTQQTADVTAATSCTVAGSCAHGTRVAGIIAGLEAPRRGVAPQASLLPIQVFTNHTDMPADSQGPATSVCSSNGLNSPCLLVASSDQRAAFDWVLTEVRAGRLRNVAAINMSIGGGKPTTVACNTGTLANLIGQLWTENIPVVISSGNLKTANQLGVLPPACIATAVTVSGTRDNDTMNPFAANGSLTDLLAPGVDISSSTLGGGYLPVASGTSYAAPHVAGGFAILRQLAPDSTAAERLAALIDTGLIVDDTRGPIGQQVTISRPRLDVEAATDLLQCRRAPDDCVIAEINGQGRARVLYAHDSAWRGRVVRLVEQSMQAGEELQDVEIPSAAVGRVLYLRADAYLPPSDILYGTSIAKITEEDQSIRLRRLFPQ